MMENEEKSEEITRQKIIEDTKESSPTIEESSLISKNNDLIVVQDIKECPYKEAVIYNMNPIPVEDGSLVLCNEMYEWLQETVPPIITMDFCGWMFPVEEDMNFMCLVSIKGNFKLMPSPQSKKFKYKKAIKVLNKWAEKGYIREVTDEDPYKEYEIYNHLKLNYSGALMIPLPVFEYKMMDKELAEGIFEKLHSIAAKGDYSNLPAIGV